MRTIHDHEAPEAIPIRIEADDVSEAHGCASHVYRLEYLVSGSMEGDALDGQEISFMRGGRAEPDSVPGVTNEALLAVVIDRLRCFQAGGFSCRENAIALTHLETGMLWLKQRAAERARRGVLGKAER